MKGPAPSKPDARRTGKGTGTSTGAGTGIKAGTGTETGAGTETGVGTPPIPTGAERTGTGNEAGTGEWQDPRTAAAGTGTGAGAGTGAGEVKRGRGRPPGTSAAASQKEKKIQASLEGIEGILLSMHVMAATFLKVPELALSDDEAKKLTQAISRVAVHYDVTASDKTLAWVNLAMCAGGIYGTRLWSYQLRTKGEESKRKEQTAVPRQAPYPFPAPNVGMGGANL